MIYWSGGGGWGKPLGVMFSWSSGFMVVSSLETVSKQLQAVQVLKVQGRKV